MPIIALEGIKIFAHHGCFEEEKVIGTNFRIDLYLETNTAGAEKGDDLEKTVNYQSVIEIVQEEMHTRSNLIEHVARRILDKLLEKFSAVESVKIRLHKLNPPVGGEVDSVSITLEENRK